MYSYAARVPVRDRWAIAAYIRLLQRARAQGQNDSPTLPGGGVYEHLAPVKSAEHEGASEGAGEKGAGEMDSVPEITPHGAVPNSFIPGDNAQGVQRGEESQPAGESHPAATH